MIKTFHNGKKWFFEDFVEGETETSTWGVEIEKKIYSGKSKFQKFFIFDTKEYGRILVLDGLIQLSTKDEFIYHEMLVHPAIICHSFPEKVLIIGGGDGGVLREVVKHPVKEIFLVDIDKKVIEVSKKYLPSVSAGSFRDKRLKIFNEDALKFVKNYKKYFDLIIYDLTDPGGPSLALWQKEFFQEIRSALKKDGLASFQTGYLSEKFGKGARKKLKSVFPFFRVHRAFVPCFPFDEHSFSIGTKKIDLDKIEPKTIEDRIKRRKILTKYYSPEIHLASSLFPPYLKEK